jgi:endonuclease/exonuclease/phosphatase family metal-dependent hydrolase
VLSRAQWAWSAVCLIGLGCGPLPLQPRDPDPGSFHFTIQTYNLLNEGAGDPITLAAIGQANADIVCLQEITATWRDTIDAKYASAYPYRMFKIDEAGAASGLGVLSRFPIRDGGWHPGPRAWHPAWNHLVDTPNGTVLILNAHLRNATGQNGNTVQSYLRTGEDHVHEISTFMDKCTNLYPTIVLGDFNEGTDGAAIRYLESDGFQNVLPLYHPGQPTWRYGRTVGGQFTQTLDHILFDSAFEPLNAWVVNAGASDHMPVVAHFEAGRRW